MAGSIKQLGEVDFNAKHPTVILKPFTRHIHGKNHPRGIVYLRAKLQERYTILGTRRLTDKVFNTTFCLVEYALNAHPLTPVSADLADPGAIKINHFLFDNQPHATPSVVGVDDINHCKRYARAQSYANTIWYGLINEYVPTLNRRSKWQTPAEQHLKTGELA